VKILRERLLISSTITELTHGSHSSRVLLGLIRANKELQAQAFEIYDGENRFQIGHRKRTTSGWPVADELLELRYQHPIVGSWVRTLELRLPVSRINEFVLANWARSNYSILMIAPDTNTTLARWQQGFPNTTHLHLALIIETKTTELVVEMSGLYCSAVNVCGGSCAETIAQTIRSRVEIREFPHE
jgi:hypothetical protein